MRFRWHLDSNSLNGPIFSREVKNAFWNLTDSTLYSGSDSVTIKGKVERIEYRVEATL